MKLLITLLLIQLQSLHASPVLDLAPEGSEYASAKFLTPNEYSNYLQIDALRGRSFQGLKTAVISVGTIRTFNLTAVLKRDALVSLDISDRVAVFNQEIARMILAMGRVEFLRAISGTLNPRADLTNYLEFHSAATQSSSRANLSPRPVFPKGLIQILLDSGADLADWYGALATYAITEEKWKATFFGSDEAYEHIRKVIRAGHFYTVTGSLSGRENFRRISDFLKEQNFVVSEIDISNAYDYIASHDRQLGIERFVQRLQRMPSTPETRVVFTELDRSLKKFGISSEGLPLSSEGWVFMTADIENFVTGANFIDPLKTMVWLCELNRKPKSCNGGLTGAN